MLHGMHCAPSWMRPRRPRSRTMRATPHLPQTTCRTWALPMLTTLRPCTAPAGSPETRTLRCAKAHKPPHSMLDVPLLVLHAHSWRLDLNGASIRLVFYDPYWSTSRPACSTDRPGQGVAVLVETAANSREKEQTNNKTSCGCAPAS